MTEKEIKLAKIRYQRLLERKYELHEKLKRIKELENNPFVKEYLSLINDVDVLNKEKELDMNYITLFSFSQIASTTKESNKLLVNVGEFNLNNLSTEQIDTFIKYIDLETDEFCSIRACDKEKFEKENKVIYLNNENFASYLTHPNCFDKKINELRVEFFQSLLTKSQDEAVKDLLNENKQKRKTKSR